MDAGYTDATKLVPHEAVAGSRLENSLPCYNPTRVVMGGDHRLHFDRDWKNAQYFNDETVINVPCRKCIGCNMATAREWSVRGFHEAQLHSQNWRDPETKITTEIPNSCVITLTYDEEHLPKDGCLDHSHFQKFMKRLRKRRSREGFPDPVRYFMCGEYGGKTQRPHFHSVIFGHDFKDCYIEQSADGQIQRMSHELDELWTDTSTLMKIGRATVDDFSFAGAAYVAGYVAKKSSTQGHQGPIATTVDAHGVVRYSPISPEYRKMSTHPGIGAKWLLKPENLQAVYSEDCIRISHWTFHPPKYYDRLLQRTRPELVEGIIRGRRDGISKQSEEWSKERCSAAEQIALSALQQRRDSL